MQRSTTYTIILNAGPAVAQAQQLNTLLNNMGKGGAMPNFTPMTQSMAGAVFQGNLLYDVFHRMAGLTTGLIRDMVEYAARTQTLGVVTESLARVNNLSVNGMNAQIEAMKRMGITTQDARASMAKMIEAQLDVSKATQLARLAQDAAVISGRNSSEAFESIVTAIATGRSRILHQMGIMVNFQQEWAKAARDRHHELADYERSEVAMQAVLQKAPMIFGTYESAMSTAGKQMTSLTRYVLEAKNAVGEQLLPAFGQLIRVGESVAQTVQKHAVAFGELTEAIAAAATGFTVFKALTLVGVPTPVAGGIGAAVGIAGFVASRTTTPTDVVKDQAEGALKGLEGQRVSLGQQRIHAKTMDERLMIQRELVALEKAEVGVKQSALTAAAQHNVEAQKEIDDDMKGGFWNRVGSAIKNSAAAPTSPIAWLMNPPTKVRPISGVFSSAELTAMTEAQRTGNVPKDPGGDVNKDYRDMMDQMRKDTEAAERARRVQAENQHQREEAAAELSRARIETLNLQIRRRRTGYEAPDAFNDNLRDTAEMTQMDYTEKIRKMSTSFNAKSNRMEPKPMDPQTKAEEYAKYVQDLNNKMAADTTQQIEKDFEQQKTADHKRFDSFYEEQQKELKLAGEITQKRQELDQAYLLKDMDLRAAHLDRVKQMEINGLGVIQAQTVKEKTALEDQKLAIEQRYAAKSLEGQLARLKLENEADRAQLNAKATAAGVQDPVNDPRTSEGYVALQRNYQQARQGLIGQAGDEEVLREQETAHAKTEILLDSYRNVYDTIKREGEGVFDALLKKGGNVWQELANSMKTAFLTAMKDIITSQIAAMLTGMVTGAQVKSGGFGQHPVFSLPGGGGGIAAIAAGAVSGAGVSVPQPQQVSPAGPAVSPAPGIDTNIAPALRALAMSNSGGGGGLPPASYSARGKAWRDALGTDTEQTAALWGGSETNGMLARPTAPQDTDTRQLLTRPSLGEPGGPPVLAPAAPSMQMPAGLFPWSGQSGSEPGASLPPAAPWWSGTAEGSGSGTTPATGAGISQLAPGMDYTSNSQPQAAASPGIMGRIGGILKGFMPGGGGKQQSQTGSSTAGGATDAGDGASGMAGRLSGMKGMVGLNGMKIDGSHFDFSELSGVGKATSVAASPAMTMAGGMMFMDSLKRSAGAVGTLESTAGGALLGAGIGMQVAGPMGALVGGAIGLGVGLGVGVAHDLGVWKTRIEQVQGQVKNSYGLKIDKPFAQQLDQMSRSNYNGNIAMTIRSKEAMDLLELYAKSTGQNFPVRNVMRPMYLTEQGGKLYQQAQYDNGVSIGLASSLPTLGGPATLTAGMNQTSAVSLSLDGKSSQAFLQGQTVSAIANNPRVVQSASISAATSSFGRLAQSALLTEPNTVLA